ncbi:MAG: GNAT family N-acetyltransferase [Solobacterium sp.]|nr:GNAT family N-acetyltransferase [Solobacterium sp.]
MYLERVTEKNIDYAVSVQGELFPEENARANYEESLEASSDFEYYLVYEDGVCAGITGLYRYPEDPESAWLGWFGIREGFRRRHLGSAVLKLFEEAAAGKGFRFARLYTDAENNDTATAFYKYNGYTGEPYLNLQDPASAEERMLIFSKSLTDGPLVLWNNRNIHLTEQIARQKKYSG